MGLLRALLSPRERLLAAALALALVGACDRGSPRASVGAGSRSPSAKPDIVHTLRQDQELQRHAADGGGRAWLEGGPEASHPGAEAGSPGRWTLVFETGPLGVAEEGWIFFQAPPFWGWSTPQVIHPAAPGYTTVATEAEGVELEPRTLDEQLLGIRVTGRRLEPGERVRIVYGAGEAGARADTYAERRSRFYLAVDGDGDGVRALVPDALEVDVEPGPPARLVLILPSTARPGESVRLVAAVLDRWGNAGLPAAGALSLETENEAWELPADLAFEAGSGGVLSALLSVPAPGVYRLRGEGPAGLVAESNPLFVAEEGYRILWADLHGHSGLSDGTGTPGDYFRYARDVAALEVVALTDHDHWGMEPLALHPELWEEIRRETELFHAPGRFVTLLGYEWTNWVQGHRHVLYFEDRGEILSAVDPAYETPDRLWSALRGQRALTVAHHSAGGPVATNWEYPPDSELEPVTEVVSVHGSSEAADSPGRIYSAVEGNFVRDILDRGYRLGFVGSGDGHDGHPGLAHLAAASGGLAAILSEELSREGVWEALKARRVYATSGPRIVLRMTLGGRPMGSVLPAASSPPSGEVTSGDELRALVVAPGSLQRLDLVRSGAVVESVPCDGLMLCRVVRRFPDLRAGEYLYLRAVQEDGAAAWSSPFFIE